MKPLNYDEKGCNSISSNCVLWQGPDIPCINLCKGDTISDVIYKLATELCAVLDELKVSTYDLSCFSFPSGPPQSYSELIQFLITQICDLNTKNGIIIGRLGTTTSAGCPDCVIDLAPCFYYVNGFGDTVTQAQITDYVTSIANRVCSIVIDITTLQAAVADNTARIIVLENATPPIYIPPTVTPVCVLPSVPEEMDIVLAALEAQFCELRSATGGTVDIYTNIVKQCAGLNTDISLTSNTTTMSSLPGWTNTVSNLAQAFGNMWVTVCDIRTAVRNIQVNCCPSGCDGIDLSLTSTLVESGLTIFISGTIPTGFIQCSGTTQIKVTDSAGSIILVNFDIISYLNNITGYTIDLSGTPINTALDITVDILPCLTNPATNATCNSCLSYTIVNTANCPEVTLTADTESVSYDFTSLSGNYTYTAELYDSTYGTLLSSQSQAAGSAVPVTGTFTPLTSSTVYNVRLTIVPTACLECPPTVCGFNSITTSPLP
jgi:hypothetical protein